MTKNLKKKLIGVLLATVIAFGLFSTMAFATNTDEVYAGRDESAIKSIQLGTSGIFSPTKEEYTPNSYIYFGNDGNYKWRVLDSAKANNGATGGVFMLLEAVTGDPIAFGGNEYQGSTVQSWLSGTFTGTNFTSEDQGAMLAITKTESASSVMAYTRTWFEGSLKGDKIFLPSVVELRDYVGQNGTSTGLSGTNTWWTRSRSTVSTGYDQKGYVGSDGTVDYKSNSSTCYVRPATNLDSSKILFTSSVYGKGTGTSQTMTTDSVSSYDGNEWKLTLLDESRESFSVDFYVNNQSVENDATAEVSDLTQSLSLNCWGAATASGNYLSAILADANGNAVSYQKLCSTADATSVQGCTFQLPQDLAGGTYTLHVFNELCNSGKATDYASPFRSIKIKVKESGQAKVTTDNGDDTTTAKNYDTLTEALKAAYNNDKADVIDIVNKKVDLDATVCNTLEKGDSIITYGYEDNSGRRTYCGKFTAVSDNVTLGTYGSEDSENDVIVISGTVEFFNESGGSVALGSGVTATGTSGVEIINKTEGSDLSGLIYVAANSSRDSVYFFSGGKVSINGKDYVNAFDADSGESDDYAQMAFEIAKGEGDAVTLTLMSGIYELGADEGISVGYGNTLVQNKGSEKITIKASYYGYKNVIVPANGKVTIGETEYVAGADGATIAINENYEDDGKGNEKLILTLALKKGSVQLDEGEKITVGHSDELVKNTGTKTITVEAIENTVEDYYGTAVRVTGTVTVPANGAVDVSKAVITDVTKETVIYVGMMNPDNKNEYWSDTVVRLNEGGSVNVNGVGYTDDGSGKGTLQFYPEYGVVYSALYVNVEIFELPEGGYSLINGVSTTFGKYVYTAPDGNVTLTYQDGDEDKTKNPAVNVKNGYKVDVATESQPKETARYTASGDSKFAISASDTNAKNIDLLLGTIMVDNGVKVTGGTKYVTAAENGTAITLDNAKNAKLVSGIGSMKGEMTVTINGKDTTFKSETEYTVDTKGNKLTLNGTGSVKALGVEFGGKSGDSFTFDTDDDGAPTVIVSAGARVTGKNLDGISSTIIGVDGGNTTVSIYEDTDKVTVCLIGGKGQSAGAMDAEIDGDTWMFDTEDDEDNKYTVDTEGALTLDEAGTVIVDGKVKFTGAAKDSFTLGTDGENDTVTIPEGATVTGSDNNAITGVGDATKVVIDDKYTIALVEGKGKTTGKMTADISSIGYVPFESDETEYTVDADNGTLTLNADGSVTAGEVTFNGKANDSFTLGVENYEFTVDIPENASITVGGNSFTAKDGSAKVSLTAESGKLTLISGKIEFAATNNEEESATASLIVGESKVGVTIAKGEKVTLNADDKTVSVAGGKSVKIGETEYTNGSDDSDMVIEVTKDGNTLKKGAVKLDGNEKIFVGENAIVNIGDKVVTVMANEDSEGNLDGTATVIVPEGGKFTFNGKEYTASGKDAKFLIDESGKIARDITGADVTLGAALVYNGSEQEQTVASVTINGETVTFDISGNKQTNAGSYTLTITGKGDFTGSVTAEWSIAKADGKIDVSGVVTSYTYNGKLQTVNSGAKLNNNEQTLVYTDNTFTTVAEGNGKVITVSVAESANYNAASATVTITVAKATYDMSGITFEDNTVVYNGEAHTLAIGGTLPSGVTVTYDMSGKTESGVYTVTAKFSGDYDNYNAIADMTATLTVKQATIENVVDGGEESKPSVIVSEENGIDPNVQLVAVKQDEVPTAVKETVKRDEVVAATYDITLQSEGVIIQPSGALTIKLLIPEGANGKTFRIVHLHEGIVEDGDVKYTIEGDYAVFTVDKLSEFSIVVDNSGSALWLIILLAVIVAAEIVLIVLKKRKTNGKSNKAYAAGLFGGVIPVAQIVLLAVLGVAAVALGAYVLYLYLPRKAQANK